MRFGRWRWAGTTGWGVILLSVALSGAAPFAAGAVEPARSPSAPEAASAAPPRATPPDEAAPAPVPAAPGPASAQPSAPGAAPPPVAKGDLPPPAAPSPAAQPAAASLPTPPASVPAAGAGPAAPAGAATLPKPRPQPVKFASVSSDPQPTLDPSTFVNTMRAAERYALVAEAGGWPALPPGLKLKLNDQGDPVAALKERLLLSEDLPPEARAGNVFDARVLAAVKRFQARHGLPETGLVAARTLEALNVPAATRVRQLTASAQRLAGSAFPFGSRYVVVNIPSATVEAVENGAVARRYVAVVGKKDRASPAVETRITVINLNPTWTVPVSLIKKDIIPHMRKDPAYLAKMKIRILDAQGHEVEPQRIDWSTEKAVNYTLRQDPGAANSLGEIRIDMPNRHAVYMHDTPTKRLFAQDARFHSSGCVRVGDVKAFAAWLLEGTPGAQGGWAVADIDAAIASARRQDIRLAKPVPVAWIYMTGYATPDGRVHFRDDVYGLDQPPPPPDAPALEALITSSIARKP